jgi:hypothetical protein
MTITIKQTRPFTWVAYVPIDTKEAEYFKLDEFGQGETAKEALANFIFICSTKLQNITIQGLNINTIPKAYLNKNLK